MIPNLCRFVCLLSMDSFSLEPISVVVKEQEQKLKDSEAALSSLQVNFVLMSLFIFSQAIRVAGRMLNTEVSNNPIFATNIHHYHHLIIRQGLVPTILESELHEFLFCHSRPNHRICCISFGPSLLLSLISSLAYPFSLKGNRLAQKRFLPTCTIWPASFMSKLSQTSLS